MAEYQPMYNPFNSHDLWKPSAFDTVEPDTSLFDLKDHNDSSISPAFKLQQLQLTDAFSISELDNFTFGELDDVSLTVEPQRVAADNVSAVSDPEGSDIWSLDLDKEEARKPRLRTWEAFLNPEKEQEEGPSYISEAGPSVWDAILEEKAAEPETILRPVIVLKSLALLGQGRSSRLFRYDSVSTFKPTLDGIRPSGISAECFESLTEHLTAIGSTFVSLRGFVDDIYISRTQITARVTFAQCVRTLLEKLEQQLESSLLNVRSLLQLQAVFDRVQSLLNGLFDLRKSVMASQDEQTIIMSLRQAYASERESAHPAEQTLALVVAMVTRPFVADLCTEIGLAAAADMHSGAMSTARALVSDDDRDHNNSLVEHRSDTGRTASGLLDSNETRMIREIMDGMDILKWHSSAHPLAAPSQYGIDLPLEGDVVNSADPSAVLAMAQKYQEDVSIALRSVQSLSKPGCSGRTETPIGDNEHEQLPWSHDERQQQFFTTVGNAFIQPLEYKLGQTSHELCSVLVADLEDSEEAGLTWQESGISSSSEGLLQPILPILQIQSRLVNGSVLRLLFHERKLRQNLDLQYQFHLLGNGSFVSRLSSALFSSASDSAEQTRGLVPSGSNLGLRLDTRDGQRWPPASSELRLTLTGILAETITTDQTVKVSSKDLPGGLSFAVRELSNEDIDKMISPQSVHALDFLKMQYTPSPPLDAIITPASLEKYDDLFRFLLRLLRLTHLVSDLKVSLCQTSTKQQTLFATSAHHTITTLSSHVLTLGIIEPWTTFTNTLTAIEQDLLLEDTDSSYGSRVTTGLSALASLHEETLDRIRSRLFLRQKQTKIRVCIENVMTIILDASALVRSPNLSATEEAQLEDLYKQLLQGTGELIRCLSELSTKSGRGRDRKAAEDAEVAGMLAQMLDFNSFFCRDEWMM
ncbi:hypothetical protein MBLNU457_g2620t1 [Dothideomycetes sp. NU457]